jgi:hypothetical protein
MAESLSRVSTSADANETLCSRCRNILLVDGVAISLASTHELIPLCTTSPAIAAFEELEFTLGVGPELDAFATGRPTPTGHPSHEHSDRWPPTGVAAGDSELGSIYAFPLSVGAARIGVLTLFQRLMRALSPTQEADALIAADVLAHVILAEQGNAPAGAIAMAFREPGSFRGEIHQASGMLSEQIGCGVADALVQLRSRAYATSTPIAHLADDVIAGRTRLVRTSADLLEWDGAE